MYSPTHRWLYGSYLWLALTAFGAWGCADTNTKSPPETIVPPPEDNIKPPPEDDTKPPAPDEEEVLPVPCTGDLCFDVNDPEIQARIQEYREWHTPRMREQLEQWEDYDDEDDIQQLAEEYTESNIENMQRLAQICSYYEDDLGRVRVKCPKEIYPYYTCPHMWFKEPFLALGGLRFVHGQDPICFPELAPTSDVLCVPGGCRDGKVCSGYFGHDPVTTHNEELEGPLPVCLSVDTCLALREAHQLHAEESCFYDDYTTVQTAEVLVIDDCSMLENGLCASNCPCTSEHESCAFLSETRDTGFCVTTSCHYNKDSCDDNEVCASIDIDNKDINQYGWWNLYELLEISFLTDILAGNLNRIERCIDAETCSNISSQNRNTVRVWCQSR